MLRLIPRRSVEGKLSSSVCSFIGEVRRGFAVGRGGRRFAVGKLGRRLAAAAEVRSASVGAPSAVRMLAFFSVGGLSAVGAFAFVSVGALSAAEAAVAPPEYPAVAVAPPAGMVKVLPLMVSASPS